jgi:hypothetical protein
MFLPDIDLTDINVMKSILFLFRYSNTIFYIKPLKQKTWGAVKCIESISTLFLLLVSITNLFLLFVKN